VSNAIDTSAFPTGQDVDYEGEEEAERLKTLTAEAWSFAQSFRWTPPIADLVLGFGIAPIVGVFLMRFEPDGDPRDAEHWVVVGDLPSMHFETDDAPNPAGALQLYCAIAEDGADNVLAWREQSDSYPIPVAPTPEHAQMLKSRIDTLPADFIPLA
jgi:hypothetical protein